MCMYVGNSTQLPGSEHVSASCGTELARTKLSPVFLASCRERFVVSVRLLSFVQKLWLPGKAVRYPLASVMLF